MNKIKRIKQAILDSTKRSKQSQRFLQKANLCYIYFTQTARAVFRYPFFYLILKCTYSLQIFCMGWNKITNFCPEITNRFRAILRRMPVYPAKMRTTPSVIGIVFDKGKYFVHNYRTYSYFYFKNFYRQFLKVTLVNSY